MNHEATIQMPAQLSTLAPDVDALYYFIYWLSVVFFVAITGAMIYFAIKHRRRPGVKAKPPEDNFALEVFWTAAPVILLVVLFHWGYRVFTDSTTPPEDAIVIRARAYKWRWEFEYPNGRREPELTVPVNQPVRLVMSSVPSATNSMRAQDGAVLHSFFVPAFRIKRDVVPGMYSSVWFQATDTGDVQVFCTEYCGTGHSRMLSLIHVVSEAEFDDHVNSEPAMPDGMTPVQWGQQLFAQNGCAACHSVEAGTNGPGPNLNDIWGHEVPLDGGGSATVDENYIRRAVLQPQAEIVQGYSSLVMPRFQLYDSQVDALAQYIQSLTAGQTPGAEEGQE